MIARRCLTLAVLSGLLVAIPVARAEATPSTFGPAALAGTLLLQTVPPLEGVVVKVDGATAHSDAQGRISVPVQNFINLEGRISVPVTQIAPDQRAVFDRFRGDLKSGARGKVIQMGVRTQRLVSWHFVDKYGDEVPVDRVESMQLRSNTGEVFDLRGPQVDQPLWVSESRTQQGPSGLVSKQLYYVVDSVVVDKTSVVHRAQQQFTPWVQQRWTVQLLFFKVGFSGGDMLFTDGAGSGIELTGPDGVARRLPFGPDNTVTVSDLPRGTYVVKIYGGGVSFARPVSISKDQQVTLSVITWLDLVLLGGVVLFAALGLVLLGRPLLRAKLRRGGGRIIRTGHRIWPWLLWPAIRLTAFRRERHGAVILVLLLLVPVIALAPARPALAGPPGEVGRSALTNPVPVLAYYYIWYTPTSWNRAKIDYPLLGRYSSDDVEIMRRHVRMAKAAGIDGFLVSWKHTPQLDERLAKLVDVARSEDFHLGIVYQGLDFERRPLPLKTIETDLALFADEYANDPVFDIFGKPVVVWTGSEQQIRQEIEATIKIVRDRLLVLGNAKSVEDVKAIGPVLDGHAYYWAAVDPLRGDIAAKLSDMSRAVHLQGGLWIAPAAPGFDARLVGGSKEVLRRDGATLRASFDAARTSAPDAIGVISWNEFSENTHIEPSYQYGATDLNVLADILGARTDITVPTDSSDPASRNKGLTSWGALLLVGSAMLLLPLAIAVARRRWAHAATGAHAVGGSLNPERSHTPNRGERPNPGRHAAAPADRSGLY